MQASARVTHTGWGRAAGRRNASTTARTGETVIAPGRCRSVPTVTRAGWASTAAHLASAYSNPWTVVSHNLLSAVVYAFNEHSCSIFLAQAKNTLLKVVLVTRHCREELIVFQLLLCYDALCC